MSSRDRDREREQHKGMNGWHCLHPAQFFLVLVEMLIILLLWCLSYGQFMSTSKQNGVSSSAHSDPDPEMDYHPHQLVSNSHGSELEMNGNHAESSDWWQQQNRQREGMIPEEMMEEGYHHHPSVHRDAAYYHQYPDQRGYPDDYTHSNQELEAYHDQRESYLHPDQHFHSYPAQQQHYPHPNHPSDHTPFTPEPENYYNHNLSSSRSKLGSSGLRNQISTSEDQNHYDVEATPTKIKRREIGGDYVQIHPWSQPIRIKRERDAIDDENTRGVGKKEKLDREGSSHKLKAAKKSSSKKSSAGLTKRKDDSEGEATRLQNEDGGDFPPEFPETHCLIVRIRPFNSLSSLGPKPFINPSSSSNKKSNKIQSESPLVLKSGITIFRNPRWMVKIDEFVQLPYEIDQERLSNTPSLTSVESLEHSSSNSNRTSTPSTSKILESLSPKSRKGLMIYQKRKSEVEKGFEFLPTAFDNRSHRNFLAGKLIDTTNSSSSSSSSEEREYRSSPIDPNGISLALGTKKKGIDLKKLWREWVRRELQSRERKSSDDSSGQKKKTFEIEKPFFEGDERNSRGPYLERNLRRGIKLRELELESEKR